jgi:pimeloyl-ACP methyl ester carboxylesterase
VAEWHAARLFLTPRRRGPYRPVAPAGSRPLTLDADGFRVVGWTLGEGPVVLLVHGWSGLANDMSELATGLARGGFRAVSFDLPAHGASPGRRTSMVEWIRVLRAVAEQLGGVHVLVGHSLGAAAVTLAIEAGVQTQGALLLAPPKGPTLFLTRIRRFIGLSESHAAGMERRLVARVGQELDFFDASRAATLLDRPALILHDPADAEVPWEHGEAIARAWRGSVLEPVPNTGHYRMLASPVVVRRTVDFVSSLPLATTVGGSREMELR